MSYVPTHPQLPLPDGDPALAEALVREHGGVLLDVRTREEHAMQSIDGSTLIPIDQLEARVPELLQHVGGDKARPIVLFCRSGRRASFAKEILRAHGFQRLTNLGSIASWPSH